MIQTAHLSLKGMTHGHLNMTVIYRGTLVVTSHCVTLVIRPEITGAQPFLCARPTAPSEFAVHGALRSMLPPEHASLEKLQSVMLSRVVPSSSAVARRYGTVWLAVPHRVLQPACRSGVVPSSSFVAPSMVSSPGWARSRRCLGIVAPGSSAVVRLWPMAGVGQRRT